MCGIAGALFAAQNVHGNNIVSEMSLKMIHRGPDAYGNWSSIHKKVFLGHRRLAIIDLSTQGTQPMTSIDNRFVIVFNGEIYNYLELKQKCIDLGSQFYTKTDTEVIIELYRHFGVNFLKDLKGMWAFCLYDQKEDEVFLSRDHFGIKPLYYSIIEGSLFFASEIPALKTVSDKNCYKDEITKKLFIENGVIERGCWTFYQNIKKFPHSCYVKFKVGETKNLSFKTYWDFDDYPRPDGTLKEMTEQYKTLLNHSIAIHSRSDVPISATLSGGMDSSSIVSLLCKQNHKIATFSTDFSSLDPNIDESFYVNEVCRHLKVKNFKVSPTLEEFTDFFTEVLKIQGEPFGTSSILSQFFTYKRIAEEKYKVTIGGQGADETLGGYDFLHRLIISELYGTQKFTHGLEWALYTIFNQKPPRIDKNYFINEATETPDRSILSYLNLRSEGSFEERLHSLQIRVHSLNDYLKYMTLETNLPQLMRYEDRNSMAFSIESRVPFLDPSLVNFSLHLPLELRLKHARTKHVLRESVKAFLPKSIINRRKKLGFPGPDQLLFKKLTNTELISVGNQQWREFIYNEWLKI